MVEWVHQAAPIDTSAQKEIPVEPFICPRCAHKSRFNPFEGPARCPRCGYSPSPDGQLAPLDARPDEPRVEHAPRSRQALRQRFLAEILGLWDGTFRADPGAELPPQTDVEGFYEDYRWALGDPLVGFGGGRELTNAEKEEERQARMAFVAGYFALRRGDRSGAVAQFQELAQEHPDFVDAWLWLAAAAEGREDRQRYLDEALVRDPAHVLARDAMAVLQGRVSPSRARQSARPQTTAVRCPQCGGELRYEPGDSQVTCAHCGHTLLLPRTDLVNGEARLVGDLRLERRLRPVAWVQVDRVLQCQQCGAELTMTRHLAQVCLFCGSPNVLNAQARPGIEQPDGFLPFSLDEGEVRQALDDAARGTLGRLWPWRSDPELRVRELQAFYLPFWVFDGFVEARSARMSLFDRNDPRAKPQVTTDLLIFENVLLSGADAPSREFQAGILPFDLGALVPYEPRLLADWPAALYSLDVEAAVETAQASMLRQAVRAAGRGAELLLRFDDDEDDEEQEVRRSFRVTSATYQLVLLPAWATLVEVKGKLRLALVNGQTGKVTLSRPLRAAP